jgi:hypothetical protein
MGKPISHNRSFQWLLSFLCVTMVASCGNPDPSSIDPPKVSREYRMLILGNSITFHGANPSIGWNGNWGMAASAADSDYVHRLTSKIKSAFPYDSLRYRAVNIATWEGNFSIDPDSLADTTGLFPNIIIIRLGENVPDSTTPAKYYSALNLMISKFKNDSSQILITGNFWASTWKDSIQRQVAVDHRYHFVDLSAIAADSTNSAAGLFANAAVAKHPSDKGMKMISNVIFFDLISNSIVQ